MTQLPASLQEAIRSVLIDWKFGDSKMVPWERMELDLTEALLPVFEAHGKAAEEAEHIRCLRVIERQIVSSTGLNGEWLDSPKALFAAIALYLLYKTGVS